MRKLQFVAFFLIIVFSAQAQKYELGEVTKQELEQKSHPQNPDAGAAILFSKGVTYMTFSEQDGFELVTEVDTKIKIYTKEGYEWANKIIPFYYSDSDNEVVDVSKAVTYNLADGAIKKTKLKSEGEFTEQTNRFWKQKKIVMPDVKEGSIVEYKYTIRSPFIHVFPEWKFQEAIPVDYSEYTTKIPEYFTFAPNFRGYLVPKVAKSFERKKYTYTTKERSSKGVVKTTFSNNDIEYSESVTKYILTNLPALKGEQFVNNIDNYTSSIEHELSMTQYPNSPIKTYSATWESVAKTIYDNDDFGSELKKTGYFEKDIDGLLAGKTAPQEKAYAIFDYVKDKMNWNSYYGYACHDGVKKAYNDKVGNVAEINLMLTAMLRYAGLDAYPVLISTRSNKIALFPNRTAFNYVIASVVVNNQVVLLDATSKSALPNLLPVRCINWFGRLIKKDGTSVEIPLIPQTSSKEVITILAKIDEQGKVSGKARDQYFDYNAYSFRENYGNVNKDSYVEKMEGNYNGIEINNYKVTNEDLSKPVVEEYDFLHNNITDVIGGKIYFNPMLFLAQTESPFKQEKREYPIDFIYPRQDKYMFTITIPEGYMVESAPQSIAIAMEGNTMSFKYNVVAQNNQLQLNVVMDINQPLISNEYYQGLKDFFQKMIEKQTEKVILTKKV